MQLYGQTSHSIPQKIFIIIAETVILIASYYILFAGGAEATGRIFNAEFTAGNYDRRLIIFIFNIVVYLRMWITLGYLLKRKIPMEEMFSIPLAFSLYYIGFAFLVYETQLPLDMLDGLGIFLFVVGSLVNTGSELQRNQWKKDPAHKGKLYTQGLFRYAMHINYFGDLLWVSGYAIITRNWYAISIPLFLFCFFAFFNIPQLDKYLQEKYGQAFDNYRKKTKKFIPFVY